MLDVHARFRQAAVDFFRDFSVANELGLQVYPARPATIRPPTAFVDSIAEAFGDGQFFFNALLQRQPIVTVIVLHGLFDSLDAVTQRDRFVDGYIEWVRTRYHQAGGETLIRPLSIADIPVYNSDWMPPERQRSYFATEISLRGDA